MKALDGFPFDVLATEGSEQQATVIAQRVDRARRWVGPILELDPAFRLVVAAEADWAEVSEFPVYGMPHAAGAKGLIVGTEPASFFSDVANSFWPHLTQATQARMRASYGDPLDLGRFVDLIAVHELGHIYHEQVPFTFPRFWLNEFFANLVMIGYLTENEPEQVELVDAFATAAVEAPASEMAVCDLGEMEASLDAGPGNYLWYQMLLVAGAISLWRHGGQRAMVALYEKFREAMDDDCIVNTFQEIHPVASRFVTEWPTRGTPPWRH